MPIISRPSSSPTPLAASPAAATVGLPDPPTGLRKVALSLQSQTLPGRGMAVSTVAATGATTTRPWSVNVDTRALLELRDRGVDLGALPMMLHGETRFQSHYTESFELAASGLPDGAAGTLVVERRDSRGSVVETMATPAKGRFEHLTAWDHAAELRLVWKDPESGQARPLFVVSAGAPPDRNTSLTMLDLLHAASASLGETVRAPRYRPLDGSGVQKAIADATADNVLAIDDVAAIEKAATLGGISPDKLLPVLDLYEKASVATWAEPGKPTPALTAAPWASAKLRDFLIGHRDLLPPARLQKELVDLDLLPLAAPPVQPKDALAYTYGSRTQGSVQDPQHVNACVRGGELVVEFGSSELRFSKSQVGTEARDGMKADFSGSGAAGLGQSKYKIHDLQVAADGTVERLSLTWVAQGVSGFGMRFGVCAGHVVFDKRAHAQDGTAG